MWLQFRCCSTRARHLTTARAACAPFVPPQSALVAATQWRRPQVVELMLARGADARGCNGTKLLSTAIRGGEEGVERVTREAERRLGYQLGPAAAIVAALLAAGAPPTPPPGCNLTWHPLASSLRDPVNLANATDRHAVLRLLLDAGADVNANNSLDLLTSAISIADMTAVRMLLRAGANVLAQVQRKAELAEYAKLGPHMAFAKTALGRAINSIMLADERGLEDASTTAQRRLIVAELQAAVRRVAPQAAADAAFLRSALAVPLLRDPSARPAELLFALAAGANPDVCVPVPSHEWVPSLQRVPSTTLQYVDKALRAAGASLEDDACTSPPGGRMSASLRMLIIVADNSRGPGGSGGGSSRQSRAAEYLASELAAQRAQWLSLQEKLWWIVRMCIATLLCCLWQFASERLRSPIAPRRPRAHPRVAAAAGDRAAAQRAAHAAAAAARAIEREQRAAAADKEAAAARAAVAARELRARAAAAKEAAAAQAAQVAREARAREVAAEEAARARAAQVAREARAREVAAEEAARARAARAARVEAAEAALVAAAVSAVATPPHASHAVTSAAAEALEVALDAALAAGVERGGASATAARATLGEMRSRERLASAIEAIIAATDAACAASVTDGSDGAAAEAEGLIIAAEAAGAPRGATDAARDRLRAARDAAAKHRAEELERRKMCGICFDAPKDTVLACGARGLSISPPLPLTLVPAEILRSGHVLCGACASAIVKAPVRAQRCCPTCRQGVQAADLRRVFLDG